MYYWIKGLLIRQEVFGCESCDRYYIGNYRDSSLKGWSWLYMMASKGVWCPLHTPSELPKNTKLHIMVG